MAENYNISLGEQLRNNEKVVCYKCKKGYFITDSENISKSHYFYCNKCGASINIDDSSIIVE